MSGLASGGEEGEERQQLCHNTVFTPQIILLDEKVWSSHHLTAPAINLDLLSSPEYVLTISELAENKQKTMGF